MSFNGDKLRLARLIASLSLDDLGGLVGASRQYVHQLETNAKNPTSEMRAALCAALDLRDSFFDAPVINPVREDDCHFRRLSTAPRAVMAQTAARATIIEMIVDSLGRRKIRLPEVNFPEEDHPSSMDDVEKIGERARIYWGLGLDGPITNIMRVAENAGAVVVHFDDITDRIDALSISRRRPIIIRSSAKTAAVRLRFDIAHEIGHLVMHQGVSTGDKLTENQAHRFAGAFLIPRKAFATEFPRYGRSLNWAEIFRMKIRWKVSARAIIRRAFDLGLIDAAQYRTGNIYLMKSGQSKKERYDDQIVAEVPELLDVAMQALTTKGLTLLHDVFDEVGISAGKFSAMTGFAVPIMPDNVISLRF